MESLNDLWVEACEELWELSKNRPFIREDATIWDAFRFMYMRMVNEDKLGRLSDGASLKIERDIWR